MGTASKSVRFRSDLEAADPSPNLTSTKEKGSTKPIQEIQNKKLSRVFSEDFESLRKKILDPRGLIVSRWNKCFLLACLASLFIDPLFFFLPSIEDEGCMQASESLKIALTIIRSVIDALYMTNIFVQFRTAYVAPSSRIVGRGELVIDPQKIASRYLQKGFWIDLLSALPLPQVLIWAAIPSMRGTNVISAKHGLRITIIFQFVLRLCLIFPLSSKIIRTVGVVIEAAWAGAVFNLMLFMLASHVIGSCWYLLSVERQEKCWRDLCDSQPDCYYFYFDCDSKSHPGRSVWFLSSNVSVLCGGKNSFYDFGIYEDVLSNGVAKAGFISKYFYCLWWGLRNLSSIGQNLTTTTYIGEINFAIIIAILGLVLFALLIGNMQTYLQASTARLEEWRVRRTDMEKWMRHRQLPREMRERVRRYDLYRWVTARGVDEEAILRELPLDLRRDIKHHLCLDLVRRVPLFDEMDGSTLDAICERLKPVLCTAATCVVREGDPVTEMLFILRGRLDSSTTNGGQIGFFNSCVLSSGDFCGDELLSWALYPRPSGLLPSSTRTVIAITEVEAFALISADVKFVASQFRKLHSKQLKHKFRFHSHQWRTWAACFIQAAWFRYKRRKTAAASALEDEEAEPPELAKGRCSTSLPPMASGLAIYDAQLAFSTGRAGSLRTRSQKEKELINLLQKPLEPDFSLDD
ncbi:protein CNGC15b-like [Andrographis paniculata]|uniref:protein CNGC15b-like n=1 Tax=Andrographis paniculata TaxID=175694 RepID=UPI0021E745D6|nr:protein CNGC15b-like [Andrographis paniculata]